MEAIDISFYNSLQYVQHNDPEPLDLNFAVLEETFGEVSLEYLLNTHPHHHHAHTHTAQT